MKCSKCTTIAIFSLNARNFCLEEVLQISREYSLNSQLLLLDYLIWTEFYWSVGKSYWSCSFAGKFDKCITGVCMVDSNNHGNWGYWMEDFTRSGSWRSEVYLIGSFSPTRCSLSSYLLNIVDPLNAGSLKHHYHCFILVFTVPATIRMTTILLAITFIHTTYMYIMRPIESTLLM